MMVKYVNNSVNVYNNWIACVIMAKLRIIVPKFICVLFLLLLEHERSDLVSEYNLEHDATPSWSGYNYQGKVALFVVIETICKLCEGGQQAEIPKYFLELEWVEDFSIIYNSNGDNIYKTIHQVKALDKTNLEDYSEAIHGLASKVIKYNDIEKAYLHTWKPLENIDDEWGRSIKQLILNQRNNDDVIKQIELILGDETEQQNAIERIIKPKSGPPPEYIKRITTNLEGEANRENLIVAIKKALYNRSQNDNEFENKLTTELLNKIEIYKYEDLNECGLNEIENKILNEIEKFFKVQGCNDWRISDHDFWITIYYYLMGKIDKHITERHKNFKNQPIKQICFKEFYQIICDEFLSDHSIDYYIYYLRNKFFNFHIDYCKFCKKRNDDKQYCKGCQLSMAIEEIRVMDMELFQKFCRVICPTVRGKFEKPEVYLKLLDESPTNFLLKTLRDIKKQYEIQNEMIRYKEHPENRTLLLTSLLSPGTDNDAANVCINIIENKEIDGLFMDIDELISKDIDVDCIFDCAYKHYQDIEILGENKYNSDHICHCKNVSIRTVDNVTRRLDNC